MTPRENITGRTLGVGGCLLLGFFLFSPGPVCGADPFEIICDGKATAISGDGSVVVGVAPDSHESWRWTPETGRVLLGNSGGATNEFEWGTPDVSRDGRLVSSTVPQEGSAEPSMGLWSEEKGWMTPSGPTPDTGGGSPRHHTAWGMTGDGSLLLGQAKRDDGSMAAAVWRPSGTLVVLGEPGKSSRAHDANRDGTVVVGWSESLSSGTRQPTAWIGGRGIVLAATRLFCEARAVNPGGSIIVGQTYDESQDRIIASLWLSSDFGWVQEVLGVLPGTLAGYGQAMALDLSDDGHTIVGFNKFDPNRSAGFIWTLEDGLYEAQEYLSSHDVELPEGFRITSVSGISADGKFLTGFGEDTTFWPHQARSFLIRVEEFPREKARKKVLPAGTGISNPFNTRTPK